MPEKKITAKTETKAEQQTKLTTNDNETLDYVKMHSMHMQLKIKLYTYMYICLYIHVGVYIDNNNKKSDNKNASWYASAFAK